MHVDNINKSSLFQTIANCCLLVFWLEAKTVVVKGLVNGFVHFLFKVMPAIPYSSFNYLMVIEFFCLISSLGGVVLSQFGSGRNNSPRIMFIFFTKFTKRALHM